MPTVSLRIFMRALFQRTAIPVILSAGIVLSAGVLKAQVISDPLLPDQARASGALLNQTNAAGGKWIAAKEVVISGSGVTASGPSGGHVVIPVIAGKIRIEADISAKGSGFTGLALGRANLSGDFWKNLGLMLTVTADRFNVFAAKKELLAAPDRSLMHEGENHFELLLDTVARTVAVRVNGKMAAENLALPKDVRLDSLTAAGFRFNEPVTANQPTVRHFKVTLESIAVAGLVPAELGMCFVMPDQEATMRWKTASPGPTKEIAYIVSDYRGERVASGVAALDENGVVNLQRKFPRGFSEITFPGAGQAFGVVALEAQRGTADPFFSIDAGLSWLETDPVKRAALVKIAERSGISMARERLGVGNVATADGKFDFETVRGFDSLRKNYSDSHVGVLEILDGGAASKSGNFSEMAKALGGVAKHWNAWGGVEAMNEPDLRAVPADQYLPVVKTMSYALTESQTKAPFVTGVFATIPPGPFFETCVANGMLEDSDAVSFHSYDKASGVEGMVARYRTWLKDAGKETLPLWHTECGWPWVNGPARPPQDQDALSALEISAKAVESRACGVARYFPFVYTYYEEGLKNFGMMGREVTPLRSMAAYANCIRLLHGRTYLGDLTGLDPAVRSGRVFGDADGGNCMAVIYTGNVDPSAKILFNFKAAEVTGADGRSLVRIDGALPVPDGIAYVALDLAEIKGSLKRDTTAMRLYEIGRQPLTQKRLSSPLVLQFLADKTPSRASSRRYLISTETAHDFPLNVRVHNLSAVAVDFTPELSLPGKPVMKGAMITVPAMGASDLEWKLDVSGNLDIAKTQFIAISGKAAGGIQPSPLAIPVVMEGTMEQHLKSHPNQSHLTIADAAKWKSNIAGHGKSTFSVTSEGAWRMDVKFSGSSGNWSYPKFPLVDKVDASRFSGFLLRARILNKGDNVAIIMGAPAAPSFWVPDLFPADGDWHVVYIPFAEFKPGPGGAGNQNTRLDVSSWDTLSIGMNSRVPEGAMEISDLILVGGSGD